MFDENILNMQYDFTTENIPAGATINVTGYGLEVNEFIDEHMKLYGLSYDNINFKYEFSKVIFTDGTVIE